jgi:MFS transporter, PHS family, inorganic phosphate transporter
MTTPMLSIIYWQNAMPAHIEAALNSATLAGTVLGQLGFGVFADVLGRKRMYGLELLIIIGSTIGIAMSSSGEAGSMNLLGWLISWRVLLGVGIGGDYPLSAVITSEFAPTRSRGRMLATVFFMQPCGYLLATLVSMVALAAYKSDLTSSITDGTTVCPNDECRRALDSVWRWTIGFGTIPAALAIYMRFSIPESPRYTTDVLNRPHDAWDDVNEMDLPTMSSPTPVHADDMSANVADVEMHAPDIVEFNESVMHAHDDQHPSLDHAANVVDRRSWASSPGSPMFRGTSSTTVNEGAYHNIPDPNHLTATRISIGSSAVPFTGSIAANDERPPSSALSPTMLTHEDSHESGSSSEEGDGNVETRNVWVIYSSSLHDYLWRKGYWVVLVGTSLTWFCFDFAFYVMGPDSYQVVQEVFNGPNNKDVYSTLIIQSWHSLIIVSLGSILGGISMIYLIGRFSPRTIQLVGFLIVFVLFIVVGLVLHFLSAPSRTPLVVFLYVISMVFFQIGPNFTTYIIPAELFPTQLRCTGVGISAAAGKTAAVIVQIFASLSKLGPRGGPGLFGDGIIVFGAFMLIGAALTKWLTPETRSAGGKPLALERLEYVGRKWPIKRVTPKSEPDFTMIHANPEDTQLPSAAMDQARIPSTVVTAT